MAIGRDTLIQGTWRLRAGGAALALAAAVPLVLAAFLHADPDGSGTHTQLGMPACGWVIAWGKPCFTCGMTTAFAHAADGRMLDSFVAQPMGALLAVLAAAAFWAGLHAALTGSRVVGWAASMLTPRILWLILGIAAASWAYKWFTWPEVFTGSSP